MHVCCGVCGSGSCCDGDVELNCNDGVPCNRELAQHGAMYILVQWLNFTDSLFLMRSLITWLAVPGFNTMPALRRNNWSVITGKRSSNNEKTCRWCLMMMNKKKYNYFRFSSKFSIAQVYSKRKGHSNFLEWLKNNLHRASIATGSYVFEDIGSNLNDQRDLGGGAYLSVQNICLSWMHIFRSSVIYLYCCKKQLLLNIVYIIKKNQEQLEQAY